MSIAEKLQLIAENEQKVYEAGYKNGQADIGEKAVLPVGRTFTGDCASHSGRKGETVHDWLFFENTFAYATYGYQLPYCTKLLLSGVSLANTFVFEKPNANILFVTKYNEGQLGICPIDSIDIEVVGEGDGWGQKYLITVPPNLGIDGVYFSCKNGGTPTLENLTGNYANIYTSGYTTGYDEGYGVGQGKGRDEGYTEGYHACEEVAMNRISEILSGDLERIYHDKVNVIKPYAFYNNKKLLSVSFPDLQEIGHYAFSGCSGLVDMELPNTITSIGNGAFQGCTSLPNMSIPDSTTFIGAYAFCYCESFTDIEIPGGISSIDEYTFSGCSNLETITLPLSITSIGRGAFENCNSLKTVYYRGPEDYWNTINIGLGNTSLTSAHIVCLDGPSIPID